jgi:hypothetical protein
MVRGRRQQMQQRCCHHSQNGGDDGCGCHLPENDGHGQAQVFLKAARKPVRQGKAGIVDSCKHR